MAERGKEKNRKRKHFEIEKSRQAPYQSSGSRPAPSSIVSKAPRAINVVEFAESRALEIKNMMMALANAASTSNKRVFQSVPRHMRRRAASHNSKRMPVRLREAYNREAAKSQEKMKEPKKKKSRRHRRRPSNLLNEYNRRQRKHVWLETHIWHAKRFKMVEKWGYMIPFHPTDKSIRASYRAMATGCLMQDISFYQCIEVSGKQEQILAAMKHLTNPDAGLTMAAKQYLNGSREGNVVMYKYDKYPLDAIGPVRFLWQQHGGTGVVNVQGSKKMTADDTVVTNLWVWSHPACSEEILNEIFHACSLEGRTQLSDVKPKNDEDAGTESVNPQVLPEKNASNKPHEYVVTALKEQLVRFRLTGPKSHALLASMVELCEWGTTKDGRGHRWWQSYSGHLKNVTDQNALWEEMKGVTSPGVLVSGAVLGLVVKDPRLGLPLKKSSVEMASESLHKDQINKELPFTSCKAGSALSPLWNVSVRQKVKQTKVTEKELNDLRSKMIVPGSKLDLGEDTSRIPIVVVQRPGTTGDTQSGSVTFGCGYDVIIPAGWSMAFWIALVYRGARVGGTRESATCSREQALAHFPCDFPDTTAGRQYNEEQGKTAGDKHEKYPPAKRPNYEKLGVASPFSGDWERLLTEWNKEVGRLQSEMETFSAIVKSEGRAEETTVKIEKSSVEVDETSVKVVEMVTHSVENTIPTPSCSSRAPFYVIRSHSTRRRLQQVNGLLTNGAGSSKRTKSSNDGAFVDHVEFLRGHLGTCFRALISLDLRLLSKGCPLTNAVVFMPTAEDLRCLETDTNYGGPVEHVHKGQGEAGAESGTLIGRCSRKAIGYVTSGQYSFARGQGAALAFCAFPAFCELVFGAWRGKWRPVVLVRNTTSFQYRFASFSVV